jgi:hypothetical protein
MLLSRPENRSNDGKQPFEEISPEISRLLFEATGFAGGRKRSELDQAILSGSAAGARGAVGGAVAFLRRVFHRPNVLAD